MREKPFFSWRQAILDSDLASPTKLVLLVLSTYMNDHGTGCYPSMETIAEKSGLSKRAVVTHIQKAGEAGFLVVKQHGFRGQKWRTNDYRIAFPKPRVEELASAPQAAEGGAPGSPRSRKKVVHQVHHVTGEGGAPGSPRSDGEVVNLVQEGGAPDDKKVVHQVHSNSPRNSPKNSPPCERGGYQDSARESTTTQPKNPGGLFRMFDGWAPREHFADMLVAAGVPPGHDWEPDWREFVLFWAHNPQCPVLNQSQWESRFRSAVLRNRVHAAARPTPLPVDWEPSPECWQQLTDAGYLAATMREELPKFALFWRDDGSPQRSWNTKFIEWVHRNIAHPDHPTETRHAPATTRSTGHQPIDWNDSSWADDPEFAEELREAAERSRLATERARSG